MATVKILDVVRVVPTIDSSDSEAQLTLPLTFFDIMCLKFQPTERVLFYRLAGLTRPRFDSEIVSVLRSSLSVTLRHYLPVAGQIVWNTQDPKPCVRFSQNDGVLLTIAESDADFSTVSGGGIRPSAELREFAPELPSSDESASVVSLQITFFPEQGFSIGVTGHHAVSDGKTAAMFIKAWAHISKQKLLKNNDDVSPPQDLIPYLDRTVIKDPTHCDLKILNAWAPNSQNRSLKIRLKEVAGDSVRSTFRLTRQDIEKLRDRVKTELQTESERFHLSSFVISYAYVFTNMVRARGGDKTRPVSFGMSADYRNRLDPPVPATYLGNCIGPESMNVTAGVLMENSGFVSAVKMISEMVTRINPENAGEKMVAVIEMYREMKPGTQIGVVTGSPRLGLYGSDFGWGGPVKVEIVTIDRTGAIAMSEGGDSGGGVELGLCLKRDEMDVFVPLFVNGLKN